MDSSRRDAGVRRVRRRTVTLASGTALDAHFLVSGVGVRPSLLWLSKLGSPSIVASPSMNTSKPAWPESSPAGDAVRCPDRHTGERIRVEHWVVAERQGQIAAKNILGRREEFDALPSFRSQHYDVAIRYVGHAENWDAVEIDGNLEARDCAVTYKKDGRTLAVVTIARDLQSLEAEMSMEAEPPARRQQVA
jgi:apoptosis-inducing factor 3